jgi:hypothetical protein
MNPLLAVTAAKMGSNLLSNLTNGGNANSLKKAEAAEAKKAAFAQMIAKVASNPQVKHSQLLGNDGISSREDAEMSLNQMAQKILQSTEVSKALDGNSEAFELKFLPDGNVSIKTANGREQTFKLEGMLEDTARKAVSIIESTKIAFPQSGVSVSKDPGGSLRILPGAKATLLT